MALRYGARVLSRAVRRPVMATKYNFTTFAQKEQGEEARFIRAEESSKQAALRAEMERILALADNHEDKKELVELLEENTEEKGFIEKMGLNDWKFALPIGMLAGIPMISNEVLIIDAEMQLTGCFILFCATLYTQVGGMVASSLDERSTEIFKELSSLDNAVKAQLTGAIKSNTLAMSIEQDLKDRLQLVDDLAVTQAQVLNHMEEHKFRNAIVQKLDSLTALEEATAQALRARTIAAVKSDVTNLFTNDRKAKDNALAQAIAVLSAGAKGKMGKDVVGEAFSDAIKKYKTNYENNKSPDEILVKMEKEMAAISEAPVVEGKGGNVYVTHRL
jgi:hypothetical protein